MRQGVLRIGALVAAALAAAGTLRGEGAATSSGALDLAAVREKAMPGVCRVVAQNAWGIPLAHANGFLLGQGRFVITDLGSVAQPGVAQVVLQFADGTTGVAKQFGLADPEIGLAALLVEGESPARGGLELAAEMPALEGGLVVAVAGWRWCRDSDVVAGRLGRGPTAKELAQRCGVEAPGAGDVFLRLDNAKLEGASGAPVLDRQGAVLAVKIDVAAKDLMAPMAVPASSFRKTLLSAQPQLKPLAELPKPLWPVRLLRIPGEPTTVQEFTKEVQALKTAMLCPTCEGKGFLERKKHLFQEKTYECPKCGGEKITFTPAVYTQYSTMFFDATQGVWSPFMDERVKGSLRIPATDMLKALAQAGPRFQIGLAIHAWTDLAGHKPMPRGIVLHGEIADTLEGPDGKYVLFGPSGWPATVLLRSDLLTPPPAKGVAARRAPSPGDKIVLAGIAMGPYKSPTKEGPYVIPLDWVPALGELPEVPGGERLPKRPRR